MNAHAQFSTGPLRRFPERCQPTLHAIARGALTETARVVCSRRGGVVSRTGWRAWANTRATHTAQWCSSYACLCVCLAYMSAMINARRRRLNLCVQRAAIAADCLQQLRQTSVHMRTHAHTHFVRMCDATSVGRLNDPGDATRECVSVHRVGRSVALYMM